MVFFASEIGGLLGQKGGVGVSWLAAFARYAKRNMPPEMWTDRMDVDEQRVEGRALQAVRQASTEDLHPPPQCGNSLAEAKRQRTSLAADAARQLSPRRGVSTAAVQQAAERLAASQLNTDFGVRQEGGAIERFQQRTGSVVTCQNTKTMYGTWRQLVPGAKWGRWRAGGRVDGVCGDHVLEVKQRVGRLFGRLPSYEYTQVATYMYVLGAQPDADLRAAAGRTRVVQQHSQEPLQGECWVEWPDEYWHTKVVPTLDWVAACVIMMRSVPRLREGWAHAGDDRREELLLQAVPKAWAVQFPDGEALVAPDMGSLQQTERLTFGPPFGAAASAVPPDPPGATRPPAD